MRLTSTLGVPAAGLAILLSSSPLAATNYAITILNDNVASNGDCSLREAVRAAETNALVDACPAGSATDTITLPLGTVIWDGGQETVTGANGSLTLRGSTSNAGDTSVSCALNSRFLMLAGAADVTLEDFSVTLCDSGAEDGGAVHATSSDLTARNLSISFSSASVNGGAIYFDGNGALELRIEESEFDGNGVDDGGQVRDPRGGAVYAYLDSGALAIVERSVFTNNTLTSATRPTDGGGMMIHAGGTSTVRLRALEFTDNLCGAANTGHDGCGLKLSLADTAHAAVEGVRFEGNHATGTSIYGQTAGGSFFLTESATLTLDRCSFDGNQNLLVSHAFDFQMSVEARNSSSAVARNCLTVHGGTGFSATATTSSALRFDHFTSSDNDWGGKLYQSGTATVDFQNSIVWGNTTPGLTEGGSLTLTSNHVDGANPLFANAGAGDYRLASSSPDRDTGDKSLTGVGALDLDHAPRVVGAQTDKGAYEFNGLFADGFESGDVHDWSSSEP